MKYKVKIEKTIELTDGYSHQIIEDNIKKLIKEGKMNYAKAERIAKRIAKQTRTI